MGEERTLDDVEETCTPTVTNKDAGRSRSVSGKKLNETAVAVPCGLIANSVFNDEFKFMQRTSRK